jgi:AcrR family transcriptional regulator
MGRPRGFDADKALDRAMQVFWSRGYEGASLAGLTEAMGINAPSLYAAFGNKEALFRKAVERYARGPAAYTAAALAQPTARGVAERLLKGGADLVAGPSGPGGCLIVQGALACGAEAEGARAELAARRTAGEQRLRERLRRARAEGDLPPGADPAALARFLLAVLYGMAVQAADGAGRKDLQKVVDTALAAWPT